MARKSKEIRETQDQVDKRKQTEDLKLRVQEFVDTKDVWMMSEFREAWNKKNSEKIQELVKIQDRMICKFNRTQVTIHVKTMLI